MCEEGITMMMMMMQTYKRKNAFFFSCSFFGKGKKALTEKPYYYCQFDIDNSGSKWVNGERKGLLLLLLTSNAKVCRHSVYVLET